MSWYLGYYFLVILIAELFLNRRLAAMDRGTYGSLLVILFAITQFSWAGNMADSLASGLRTLLIGVFLYAMGGYLRKYRPLQNIKTVVFPLAVVAMYAVLFFSYHNDVVNGIQNCGSNDVFIQKLPWYSNYHPIIIAMAICMFEFFSRLHLANSKAVNFIGGSTLMIYLLHDNSFCYALWDKQDWITALWKSPIQFAGKLAAWVFGTFFAGLGIYCLYVLCQKAARKLKPLVTTAQEK